MHHLKDSMGRVTGRFQKKYGDLFMALAQDWSVIVEKPWNNRCVPERITKERLSQRDALLLIVRTYDAFSLELSYNAPWIKEKINLYFGYHAIDKVRVQGGLRPMNQAGPHYAGFPQPVFHVYSTPLTPHLKGHINKQIVAEQPCSAAYQALVSYWQAFAARASLTQSQN